MTGADLVYHRLPVLLNLRQVLLREAPSHRRLNDVIEWALLGFVEIRDQQDVRGLIHEMTVLKVLVYHSHVVDLRNDEPFLGRQLAVLVLLERSRLKLKTCAIKVCLGTAVWRNLEVVLL